MKFKFIDRTINSAFCLGLLNFFYTIFKKFPKLPNKLVSVFVFLAPWLALLSGVLGILAGPVSGLLGLLSFVTLDVVTIIDTVFSAVIMILNTILMFKAFKPLKQRLLHGWIYLFWSNILWLLASAFDVALARENIWVVIIANLLSFYLLFEMKRLYTDPNDRAPQVTTPPPGAPLPPAATQPSAAIQPPAPAPVAAKPRLTAPTVTNTSPTTIAPATTPPAAPTTYFANTQSVN